MTIALLRLPMFGFFGLGFLLFCTIVAIGVWIAFRSGEQGTTKLGGVAGCAIAFALFLMAGIGALGCTTIALLNTPNEIVRRGPVRSFELHWDEDHEHDAEHAEEPGEEHAQEHDEDHAVSLRFEITGVDPSQVTNWLRDHTDGDVDFTVTTGTGEDGEVVHLDVSLPVSRDEVRRIREDFHRDFPDLRMPVRLRVELEHEDEDE